MAAAVKYLLDTNAVIRYLSGRSEPLRARLAAQRDDTIAVCSIVRAELLYGAAKSTIPHRTLQAQQRFLDRFPSLPFDDAAAWIYGPLRAYLEREGTPIGSCDLLIAAIALARNLTLVTHNLAEFARVPHLLLEDWEAG
jgi:tRNA(fMet)-specific endonuclease VapC